MSDRFDQATRDYYDGKITAQEFHQVAVETGHDWYAAADAIGRVTRAKRRESARRDAAIYASIVIGCLLALIVVLGVT